MKNKDLTVAFRITLAPAEVRAICDDKGIAPCPCEDCGRIRAGIVRDVLTRKLDAYIGRALTSYLDARRVAGLDELPR